MNETVSQERDALPIGRILVVSAVSIAIGAGATAWAWAMERPIPPQLTRAIPPSASAHSLEDALYGTLEHAGGSAAVTAREQRTQLQAWSWADRDHGLVNMPIDEALGCWLERDAHAGAR